MLLNSPPLSMFCPSKLPGPTFSLHFFLSMTLEHLYLNCTPIHLIALSCLVSFRHLFCDRCLTLYTHYSTLVHHSLLSSPGEAKPGSCCAFFPLRCPVSPLLHFTYPICISPLLFVYRNSFIMALLTTFLLSSLLLLTVSGVGRTLAVAVRASNSKAKAKKSVPTNLRLVGLPSEVTKEWIVLALSKITLDGRSIYQHREQGEPTAIVKTLIQGTGSVATVRFFAQHASPGSEDNQEGEVLEGAIEIDGCRVEYDERFDGMTPIFVSKAGKKHVRCVDTLPNRVLLHPSWSPSTSTPLPLCASGKLLTIELMLLSEGVSAIL